jgi:hypothetical protein
MLEVFVLEQEKDPWYKNRHEGQQDRTEDPDRSPHSYSQLMFLKKSPKHTMEKRQPLQQMLLEKLDLHM